MHILIPYPYSIMKRFCLFIILFSISFIVHAQTIYITDSSTILPTKHAFSFLEDESNTLELKDVISKQFTPDIPPKLKSGWTAKTHWAHFTIHNKKDISADLTFTLPNRFIDSISFYVLNSDSLISSAFYINGKSESHNIQNFSNAVTFNFSCPPQSNLDCYIQLKNNGDIITFTPSLYTKETYSEQKEIFVLISGLYLGILVVLWIFSLSYFNLKGKVFYRYYSVYLLTILILTLSINGFLHYALPFNEKVSDLIFSITMFLNLFSFLSFITSLLNTKTHYPIIFNISRAYTHLILPIIFLLFIDTKDFAFNIAVSASIPLIIIIIIVSLYKNLKASIYFLAIVLFSSIGVIISRNASGIENNFFTSNMFSLTFLINIVILFIAVLREHFIENKEKEELAFLNQKKISEHNQIVTQKNTDLQKEVDARKKAEFEQKQLQEQLIESNKMETMGKLAGGIAHDFNNILTPIIGHADLALEDCKDDYIKEDLQLILKSATRAKELVKQILTFSRRYKQESTAVDIYQVIQETIDLLHSSFPKNISIEYNLSSSKLLVLANEGQLQQVILNLCTNAKDAIGDKSGIVKIKQSTVTIKKDTPELKKGLYGKMSISDNGSGMDEETLQNIFFPFYTTKPKGSGTGLGLSVVHGIINAYSGTIQVESTLGKGTTFHILLPLAKETKNNETKAKLVEQDSSTTGNILVVDDEEAIRNMIALKLTRLGFSVTTKENGRIAYEYLQSINGDVDLVLTDQMMPEMNGDELIAKINEHYTGTNIILITGYSEKLQGQTAEDININEIIMKPFDFKELVEKVQKLLA